MNETIFSPLCPTLLAMGNFALVGAITPGPVNVLALRHGSQRARQPALGYVLGASLSYGAVVACMGLASAPLLQQLPQLAQTAEWLCAAYLLWLAWRLASAKHTASSSVPASAAMPIGRAFVQGAAVQTLNPKAWLFALSAVGLFVLPYAGQTTNRLGLLCAVSLVACMVGVGCWALLGRTLVRWLQTPLRQQRLH
ncbi:MULTISPECIES: LysE family translocator [Comamonas]|uniref:LysE family translocator n=1 Tax=Comamonas TaxID=283 RepID=UPI00257ABD6C|nr:MULTISPECIES: LysE family translocator [Comamonas]